MDEALKIREFWFGAGQPPTRVADDRLALWFGTGLDPATLARQDERIRSQFSPLLDRAARGELAAWETSPRRRLSLIILLDQVPRAAFRGSARAFAYDAQALSLALFGMQSAADGALTALERLFFYMPLQHAEQREVQDESAAAYRRLVLEASEPLRAVCQAALDAALRHREIVARFGRFPHRNAALARASTDEELAWLASGERFGQ